MQKKWFVVCIVLALVLSFSSSKAFAGAKLVINDDSSLDLGFMVNSHLMMSEADIDGDGKYDGQTSFGLKRARIRLKGDVGPMASFMYQTEVGSPVGDSGFDIRMLEAYINLKFNPWLQVGAGQIMAPVMRQHITSTGALMCLARPNLAFKNLTWGMTGKAAITNATYTDGVSGITAPVASRDAGAVIWGNGELATDFHLKYYLGLYDGVQAAGKDNMRITARVQFNFLDPEDGFWVSSTYLGKKETIGIGFAYDAQSDIGVDSGTGKNIDYTMYTFDIFADMFITDYNPITFEAGYVALDLSDPTGMYQTKSASTGALSTVGTQLLKQVQGDGIYMQLGYLLADRWQPWIEYETWGSDAVTGKGGYDAWRIGLNYYIKGHNANIKMGYEQFSADAKIGTSTTEDSIGTFLVGAYLFY